MSHPLRIARYALPEGSFAAAALDEGGRPSRAAADAIALAAGASDPALLEALRAAITAGTARLAAPVEPSKVVCIGLNYRKHAEEMNKPLPDEPVIFTKPTTAVIGPTDVIRLPADSNEVHHEGELAVVIGRRATAVSEADAMDHVLGWTVMNDVTARDIQRREGRYTRAKGYDTFAPLGPVIVTSGDPDTFAIETRVDGELRQRSGCDDLIFRVPTLIAWVSRIMTLLPGDVLSTGTPSGVGPIEDGQVVTVEIAGIGRLENPVRR